MDAYDYTLNAAALSAAYCYAAFFSRDIEKQNKWGLFVIAALLKKRKPGFLDGKRIYMSSVGGPISASGAGSRIDPPDS